MPIKFRCPHCRQFLGISRSKAGALTDCPSCGRTIRIPDLEGKVKPLPEPKLNLGDSELAGALDALARLDAPAASEASASSAGAAESSDEKAPESKPAAVAIAASNVRELEPIPQAEPVTLEPALPAERAVPSKSGAIAKSATAPARVAGDALDEIIRLNPAAARSETTPSARFSSGTLLAVAVVGAAAVFGVGFIIGRNTAPTPAADPAGIDENADSSPPSVGGAATSEQIPVESAAVLIPALSGRLTYATADGGIQPDNGARIIVFPEEREGTAKLSVAGFRAGAVAADQTLSQTSIRALGGNYAIADEQGQYTVRLASAGAYRVLFLSRFQPHDNAEFLEPALQEALSNYFDRPAELIGRVAYEFTEFTFRGDEAVPLDHVFQRE